jgi:hypothetical protein
MHTVENLILGCGFTALEFARHLDSCVLVSADMGGLIKTHKIGPFAFDLGGHVYTLDHPYIYDLMKAAGAQIHTERHAYYFAGDRWVPYPVQAHAADLGIELRPEPQKDPANLAEYAVSVFGRAFWDEFLGPFNRRVWGVSPHLLSKDWIYGRIKLPAENDEKWGANAQFAYAPGYRIVSSMLERIKSCDIVRGRAVEIDYAEHCVYTTAGSFKYANLFDTTGLALEDEVASKRLLQNYVAVIGIGFNKPLPFDFHWGYGKLGQPVHRITMLSRYHAENAPHWGDSLLLEIPVISPDQLPDTVKIMLGKTPTCWHFKAALDLIEAAGLSTAEELNACRPEVMFTKLTRAYPVPILGARQIVARQKAMLLEHNVYTLGRWGSHGYFNLQHLVEDVDATLDVFQNRVSDLDHPYFTGSFYYRV